MHSEERPPTFEQVSLDSSEQIPKLQRRTIHPDSLKFMDMAKNLLDSPEIKQAVESEQQKQKDSNF